MAIIYHIATESEWNESLKSGCYQTASLKDEGFIHCCQEHQVQGVLQRYFLNRCNLLILEIETDKLASPFYFEWSPSTADTFPHIYGTLNPDAVQNVRSINVKTEFSQP